MVLKYCNLQAYMQVIDLAKQRSGNKCELCNSTSGLSLYEVAPKKGGYIDDNILVCEKCYKQIEKKEELDASHWKCLTEAMWSETIAVQIVAWRMLNRLRNETWANELIDMMYLDDENLAWAKQTGDHENSADVDLHRDCNGNILQHGDNVVLVKSLDVKGSTVNARLGTVIHNIKLDNSNTDYIEGKIEGQSIMILTKYVRKN